MRNVGSGFESRLWFGPTNGLGFPALVGLSLFVPLCLSGTIAPVAGPTFLRCPYVAFDPFRATQDQLPCECRPGFHLRGPGDYGTARVQQQTRPAPILFWLRQHSFARAANCRVASEY